MNDDVKEQNSTPPEELKRQIMSYSEPKNEREWWAMHRIEQLEAALRMAAGYISTKEGHTDQHPQDVYNWLVRAALDAGAE